MAQVKSRIPLAGGQADPSPPGRAALLLVDFINDMRFDGGAETRASAVTAAWVVAGLRDAADAIQAQAQKVDLADLGRRIAARKQQLQLQGERLRPSRPVSLRRLDLDRLSTEKNDQMPRNYDRDRDDRGRFISDDEDDRNRSRYGAERYGASRRYDEDDRGRGHGGWYGDQGGHSEASRRGWDERRSFRGDREDDDDRGYRSRGRDYDDDDDRGRGRSGWYGDAEGHSEASRRGWDERRSGSRYDDDDDRRYRGGPARDEEGRFLSRDDDDRDYRTRRRSDDYDRDDHDRGRGGWFGDSRGHAEAARRGWDERGRDDARASRRDDEGDRRSSGSRNQGGWFGDSRGHSQAARRGWEGRR